MKCQFKTSVAAGFLLLVVTGVVQAHHSIANVYDFKQRVALSARVVSFEFINPHPFVTVDAEGGTPRRWRLEMDNRHELAELGFKADTLQPGDRVRLVVNPSRSDADRGYVRELERQRDSFRYRHHD